MAAAFLVKQKGLAQFLTKLSSSFVRFDKKVLNEIGQFTSDRIRSFTRTGKSIVGESPVPLKPLSPSYVAFRRGKTTFWKKDGKTIAAPFRSDKLNKVDSQFFKPTRSNLTFTGELMKSISYKVDITNNSVLIKPKGARNEKVAGYVSVDRPFMGLDKVGRERVSNFVRRAIRERLKLTK